MDEKVESSKWRVGRKVGRTIYLQVGDEPSDNDELIGVMDTPELASQAVKSNFADQLAEALRDYFSETCHYGGAHDTRPNDGEACARCGKESALAAYDQSK